jgi:Uma2 family endonuclease
MGRAAPTYYTADMVRTMPDDGNCYETVHGELLVTPAPGAWHQVVLGRLHGSLLSYLTDYPVGYVIHSPADISWGDDTLVQPDLFVADLEQVRTLDWRKIKTLLLVIEVLSPSTARYDRFTKRRLYQEVEIPDYWIVDPDRRLVELWTPDRELPDIERSEVTWHPAGAAKAFAINLEELFRPI